jgi:hypothetical protein
MLFEVLQPDNYDALRACVGLEKHLSSDCGGYIVWPCPKVAAWSPFCVTFSIYEADVSAATCIIFFSPLANDRFVRLYMNSQCHCNMHFARRELVA